MRRDELAELHHLTVAAHVPSILRVGILSHVRAASHRQVDISNPEIQDRRAGRQLPGGRPLHEYACLYIHARNAMLFSMKERRDLTIVAINTSVLDLPGVVVSDRNASTYMPLFQTAEDGIEALDAAVVLARDWTASLDSKQRRQAEVLVPDVVPPEYLLHAYVPSTRAARELMALIGDVEFDVHVNADLFFAGGPG